MAASNTPEAAEHLYVDLTDLTQYIYNHYDAITIQVLLPVTKITLRCNLRAPNFEKFPGGACPQTPLASACYTHAGIMASVLSCC